jgi:hypothetical protein
LKKSLKELTRFRVCNADKLGMTLGLQEGTLKI